MQRRPEPLQTTRMLGTGLVLWLIYAVEAVWNPSANSVHALGFLNVINYLSLYGGLLFLAVGMFLRATSWVQEWRDGTDGPYQVPGDVIISERLDFPAEDDPDF